MPKSTDSCNRILNLMYSATAWPTVADNAAATPLTNVYVGLHTSTSLTAATNSQAENEVAYTNYARVARAQHGLHSSLRRVAIQRSVAAVPTVWCDRCNASGCVHRGCYFRGHGCMALWCA